jgi:hypothetical protein
LMLVGFIGCQPVVAAHHDDHYLAEHRYERMWQRCPFGERLQWLRGESNTPKRGTKRGSPEDRPSCAGQGRFFETYPRPGGRGHLSPIDSGTLRVRVDREGDRLRASGIRLTP